MHKRDSARAFAAGVFMLLAPAAMAQTMRRQAHPRASLIVLGQAMSKRRGRLLFVNKKKQKNFIKLGRAADTATGPAKQKFFAPLFFKKAAPFLSPLKPIMLQVLFW
jgi:hypothetical protein